MEENKALAIFNKVVAAISPSWVNFSVSPSDISTNNLYVPGRKDPTPKDLSTYIAPVQLARFRQDVATWREAVSEAENAWYPQRVRMQRLYLDTILNGHVDACLNKRRDLTMLREFRMVDKNGNINEEWTKYFKKQWFRDYLYHALNARFFGYSLIQLGDIVGGVPKSVKIIKRHNISPDRCNVTQYVYSISGIPFLEEPYSKWVCWVPTASDTGVSDCGYGELYKVGLYEILMRNLLGWNSDYVEIFGQPYRIGKTDKTQNDPEREMFRAALRDMGSNGSMIIDLADEVELLQSSTSGTKSNPYENLEARSQKYVSKILLGHADAIDSIPGKLGNDGEKSPAQKSLEDKQINDGHFIINNIECELLPKLRALGIPIPDGLIPEFSNDHEKNDARNQENESNQVVATVAKTLKDAGFTIDPKYIVERTGIPVEKSAEPPAPLAIPKGITPAIKNRLEELYSHAH